MRTKKVPAAVVAGPTVDAAGMDHPATSAASMTAIENV